MSRATASALTLLLSLSTFAGQTRSLVPVRVDVIEALSPKDTTSSLRFQSEFEQAIKTAKAHLDARLAKCGYSLEAPAGYFDANDPLQAKEKAELAVKNGAWAIVGPRRSNHYLLLAKGSGDTPTISLMASATEVGELGPLHISLSPSNAQMAAAAAIEAKKRTKKPHSFAIVTSEDCVSCVDFTNLFKKEAAKIGLRNRAEFWIKGEAPALQEIAEKVANFKPEIVLVPNFSKVSALVISAIENKAKGALFVGSDGWGDASFGFLQNDASVSSASGITVRGFPPVEKALAQFPLGKEVVRSSTPAPTSGPGVAVLKALEGVSDVLCASHPRTKEAFNRAFERSAPRNLSAPFGVSVYKLNASNITYEKKAAQRE